jgi:hypothetical protein
VKRGGFLARKTPLKRRKGFKQKRTKLKRTRLDNVGKLKKELWALCRQLTFKKYGNDCYTCGARELSGSNLHCGHFITKSTCSAELAYGLSNLRPQCYRCNIHLSGNWVAYELHLVEDGVDVEELKRLNRETKGLQYDRLWYQSKIQEYKALLG